MTQERAVPPPNHNLACAVLVVVDYKVKLLIASLTKLHFEVVGPIFVCLQLLTDGSTILIGLSIFLLTKLQGQANCNTHLHAQTLAIKM
eukprot:4524644-Amphidinium_carterae.1